MRNVCCACLFLLVAGTGCAPALVAGGATGAYKVATDQRSMGRIIDDSTITANVATALAKDPRIRKGDIDVDTLEGEVLLTGVVKTEEEARRAVELALAVEGVRKVKNNLQVGMRTWGQAVDDKGIWTRVKTALVAEPGIRSLNIDVDVANGVVTLSGTVDTPKHKERVIDIARKTPGTVKVVDNLKVRYP